MAEHTPGPWIVTGVSMTTGNISVGMKEHRIVIAEVTNAASFGDMLMGAMKRGGGGFDQGDCHTQYANARLIAAAPDLFELAEDAIPILEAVLDDREATNGEEDEVLRDLLKRFRTATRTTIGSE